VKLGWLAVLAAGCVFHVDDLGGGSEDRMLYVDPSDLPSGRSVVSIADEYSETDFSEVWEVRSMGDFAVVDWEGRSNRLDVVVEVDEGAEGEQPIAIEFQDGTSFVGFEAR
jgi:hypothetical protein